MSSHIDFYFDIISPYSYIAHKKIQKIKEHQKVIFNYKPILLGGLHNLAGISAPAFNKYKMKNMQSDCELVSKKNNISFKWNLKFPINSLSIMRGYLSLEDSQKEDYLNIFFNAIMALTMPGMMLMKEIFPLQIKQYIKYKYIATIL